MLKKKIILRDNNNLNGKLYIPRLKVKYKNALFWRTRPRQSRRCRCRRQVHPGAEAPVVAGYKRVRIQYRKLLPYHAQSFTRNLVLPCYRGGYLSFCPSLSLSSSFTHASSLFLSLSLSFNLQCFRSRRRSFYF